MYRPSTKFPTVLEGDEHYYGKIKPRTTYQVDDHGGARYRAAIEAHGNAKCYERFRPAPRKKPRFTIIADWYFCYLGDDKEKCIKEEGCVYRLWEHLSQHGCHIYVYLGDRIERAVSPRHLSELVVKIVPAKSATVLEIAYHQLKLEHPDLTSESIHVLDYFTNNALDETVKSSRPLRRGSPFTGLPVLHLEHLRGANREQFQLIMASIPEDLQFGIVITGAVTYKTDDRYQLSPEFIAELFKRFNHNIQGISLHNAENIFPVMGPLLMSFDSQHIKQLILRDRESNDYDRYKVTVDELLAFITHYSLTECLTLDCKATLPDSKALTSLTQLRTINVKRWNNNQLPIAELACTLPKLVGITVDSSRYDAKPINIEALLHAIKKPKVNSLTIQGNASDAGRIIKLPSSSLKIAVYPHVITFILRDIYIDALVLANLLTQFPNLETLILYNVKLTYTKEETAEFRSLCEKINLPKLKHFEMILKEPAAHVEKTLAFYVLNNARQLMRLELCNVMLTMPMNSFPLLETLDLKDSILAGSVFLGFDKLISLKRLFFSDNKWSDEEMAPSCAFPALMEAQMSGNVPRAILLGVLQQAPQLQSLDLHVDVPHNAHFYLPSLRLLQLQSNSTNSEHANALLSACPRLEALTVTNYKITSHKPVERSPLTNNHLLRIRLVSVEIAEDFLSNLLVASPHLLSLVLMRTKRSNRHDLEPEPLPMKILPAKGMCMPSSFIQPYCVTLHNVEMTAASLQHLSQSIAHTQQLNICSLTVTAGEAIETQPIVWPNLRYFSAAFVAAALTQQVLAASPELLSFHTHSLEKMGFDLPKNLVSVVEMDLDSPDAVTLLAVLQKTPQLKRLFVTSNFGSIFHKNVPTRRDIATSQLVTCHICISKDDMYILLNCILPTQCTTLETLYLFSIRDQDDNKPLKPLPQVVLPHLQNFFLATGQDLRKTMITAWIEAASDLQRIDIVGDGIDAAKVLPHLRKLKNLQNLEFTAVALTSTQCANIKLQWPHALIKPPGASGESYEPGFTACEPIRKSSGFSPPSWWRGSSKGAAAPAAPIRRRDVATPFDNDFLYNPQSTTERHYFSAAPSKAKSKAKGLVREGSAGAHDQSRIEVDVKQYDNIETLKKAFSATEKGDVEIGWYEDVICVSSGKDEALTTFSEEDKILGIYTDANESVKVLHCAGEQRYYIATATPVPQSIQVAAIVQFTFFPYVINSRNVIAKDAFLADFQVNVDEIGNLILPEKFRRMPREQFIDSLANAIQNFDPIQSKPKLPPPPPESDVVGLCNYMLKHKIGYCRQRAWLFKWLMKAYDPLLEVQLSWNSNHMFIHMRLDKKGKLFKLDLGGDGSGEFTIEMFKGIFDKVETLKETKATAPAIAATTIAPVAPPPLLGKLKVFEEFYQNLIKKFAVKKHKMGLRFVPNGLWYCQNEMHLELFQHLMETYFRTHKHPYCFIPDLADIPQHIDDNSEFGQFLKIAKPGSVLVINLSNMHLGGTAANSIFDWYRRFYSTLINRGIHIIALLPENMQHHHSIDFFRRFSVEETIPASLQTLIDPLVTLATPSSTAVSVPLYDQETALSNLWGRTVFDKGRRVYQAGILQPYLQTDAETEIKDDAKPIEIALQNAPLHDAETRRKLRRLLPVNGLPGQFFIAGKPHNVASCVTITLQKQVYNFAEIKNVIAEAATNETLALCQFVITPELLKTFISPNNTADEKLQHWNGTPNIFEQENGKTIIVRVRSGSYTMATWAYFFATAAQHNVTLRLVLEPTVIIPTLKLTPSEAKASLESKAMEPWNMSALRTATSALQVIVSDTPALVAKQLLDEKLIDICDYYPLNPSHTAADVIDNYEVSFNADGTRKIVWHAAAIAKKLCSGKLVVIENISAELAEELSSLLAHPPYLWMNGKKQLIPGRLLILSYGSNPYYLGINTCYRDLPRTTAAAKVASDVTESKAAALSPVGIASPETKRTTVDENQQRFHAIDHGLQKNPSRCVYVQGDTGTGKTTSICDYPNYYKEKYKQDLTVFRDRENLAAFLEYARANPTSPCMLHIDEANTLEEDDLAVFESLYHSVRPGIHFKQAEFYDLQPNMHFVFSGNPKRYGRNAHPFLDDHPEIATTFLPFSPEHIRQYQYLPWLEKLIPALKAKHADIISGFMNAETLITPHLQKALTPRNREMICLRLLLLRDKKLDDDNAASLAVYQEFEALIDQSGKEKLQKYLFGSIENYQALVAPLQEKVVKSVTDYCLAENFYPVTSRQSIIANLLNLLELTEYRCKHPELHNMGVRGVILEGPTDGGKSRLVNLLLAALREKNSTADSETKGTTPATSNPYDLIFLDPNDDKLQEKLEYAYDHGQKFLIDESNTIINPQAYEKALNFYLTDLPRLRPPRVREGSFGFFTQNPASTYKNRYSFSPALLNRLSFINVPWFNDQDLTEIQKFMGQDNNANANALKKSYLDSTKSTRHRFTIDQFIEEVKNLPLPTLVKGITRAAAAAPAAAQSVIGSAGAFFAAANSAKKPATVTVPVKKTPAEAAKLLRAEVYATFM